MANDALYNIKQITNFDIENNPDEPDNSFAHFGFDKSVSKLGYCCEPKGIGEKYPIKLYLSTKEDPILIEIGKTGMFEVQPEDFIKVGEDDKAVSVEMAVEIVGIDLPKGIRFVLDYAYKV